MATIQKAESVKFCNEKVRVSADKLAQLYYLAKAVSQEWTATQMGNDIVYNNTDLVVDGSETDGRHPITGVDVNNIINRLTEFVTDMEAGGSAKLNTILAVAVNPRV